MQIYNQCETEYQKEEQVTSMHKHMSEEEGRLVNTKQAPKLAVYNY